MLLLIQLSESLKCVIFASSLRYMGFKVGKAKVWSLLERQRIYKGEKKKEKKKQEKKRKKHEDRNEYSSKKCFCLHAVYSCLRCGGTQKYALPWEMIFRNGKCQVFGVLPSLNRRCLQSPSTICPSIHPSVGKSVSSSVQVTIGPSIRLFNLPSVLMSVRLSVCPSFPMSVM